jgi:Protein of unknown function (DUF3780)
MRRATSSSARKVVGLGFLPDEARHGFLIDVPKGNKGSEMICITEHRGSDLDHLGARSVNAPSPNDPSLRVIIDRARWSALAPAFWEEANRRLRANGLPTAKFQKNPAKPVPVHPSLGKELCILCWAVEDASPDDVPNALRNWERTLVALHHDRGDHGSSHAERSRLAQSSPSRDCRQSLRQR